MPEIDDLISQITATYSQVGTGRGIPGLDRLPTTMYSKGPGANLLYDRLRRGLAELILGPGCPSNPNIERCAKFLDDAISPGGENNLLAYQNFVRHFHSSFTRYHSDWVRRDNACFFCGAFDIGDKFVRAAHIAEAYVTTTGGGARDASDPVFRALGGAIGNDMLNELPGTDGLAQPLWRFLSSLLATKCEGDVMVIAPGGITYPSIFWFDELPILNRLQASGKVKNIYYYTDKAYPPFVQVDQYGKGFGADGSYSTSLSPTVTREHWHRASHQAPPRGIGVASEVGFTNFNMKTNVVKNTGPVVSLRAVPGREVSNPDTW